MALALLAFAAGSLRAQPAATGPLILGWEVTNARPVAAPAARRTNVVSAAAVAPGTASDPAVDPLVALMIAQPAIDTTSPVTATAEFDPPVVGVGQVAVYRVMMNALQESVDWPAVPALPPGLEFQAGGRGTLLRGTGTSLVPDTTFLYHARAATGGVYRVPGFMVKAYGRSVSVPAATLQVVAGLPPNATSAQRLLLETPGREFYVGQSIPVRVLTPPGPDGSVRVASQIQVRGDDFVVDRSLMMQRVENVLLNGHPQPVYVYETVATPIRNGSLVLAAQGFVSTPRVLPPTATNPAAMTLSYPLVDSEPVQLTVRPLPREGVPPGFNGAIGAFQVEPPRLSTNRVRAGDPVQLSVTVRGVGNLERFIPPPPAADTNWQVFPAVPDETVPTLVRMRGFTTFTNTLIPLVSGAQTTPPIPFAAFDPRAGRYVDLTIPGVEITVEPAPPGAATNHPALVRLARDKRRMASAAPLKLSGLAATSGRMVDGLVPLQQRDWFPLFQLGPLALLAAVWGWARRRRFLEDHPGIVVRQRARRALRRHRRGLRQAAARRNADAFLAHALGGLREGCAPHAPADPLALACADILAGLPRHPAGDGVVETNGRESLVRDLFTAADAWRYAQREPDRAALLALHPPLDRLLEELHRRL